MGCGVGVTQQHNIMVGRVCILILLAAAKGCWWIMEQPAEELFTRRSRAVSTPSTSAWCERSANHNQPRLVRG